MPQPEQRLLEAYSRLDDANRDSLLSFAEFLLSRQPDAPTTVAPQADAALAQPQPIPPPADESVVAAIRRLRQTYPMIARATVFQHSSTLMTRHIIEGIDAETTVDALETLFSTEYDKLKNPEPAP